MIFFAIQMMDWEMLGAKSLIFLVIFWGCRSCIGGMDSWFMNPINDIAIMS